MPRAEALPPALQARAPHKTAASDTEIQDGDSDGVQTRCAPTCDWGMNGTGLRELSPLPAEAVRCPDKVATT